MQRRLAVWACLVVCITAVAFLAPKYGAGNDENGNAPPNGNEPALMRAKLASSQKVLEGLLTEDFELIRKGAEEMHKISEAAEWRTVPDPVYDHYSAEFRRLAEKLIHLAEGKNIEGAAFSHMHLTTVCISCHEHVRDVVRLTAAGKAGAAAKPDVAGNPSAAESDEKQHQPTAAASRLRHRLIR